MAMDDDFFAGLAKQTDADQAQAFWRGLGGNLRIFYASLTDSGFSEQQAMGLLVEAIKALFISAKGNS